jgi:DNA invertase Pin-like site-specific DNA recombinase
MVRKVAIYTRVSTLDQTIDNQLIELRDYCSKMGWEITREKISLSRSFCLPANGNS